MGLDIDPANAPERALPSGQKRSAMIGSGIGAILGWMLLSGYESAPKGSGLEAVFLLMVVAGGLLVTALFVGVTWKAAPWTRWFAVGFWLALVFVLLVAPIFGTYGWVTIAMVGAVVVASFVDSLRESPSSNGPPRS